MPLDAPTLLAAGSGLAALAVLLALVFLARNVGRLAAEAGARNAELRRANVVASVEPPRREGGRPELVLVNAGPAAAFDVRVTFDPPLFDYAAVEHVRAPLRPVGVLRPGQEIVAPLPEDSVVEDRPYGLALSWKSGPNGARESLRYEAVIRDPVGAAADQGEALGQIADYLRRMRKDYRSVAQKLGERPVPRERRRDRGRERERVREPQPGADGAIEAAGPETETETGTEPEATRERRRSRRANGDARPESRRRARRAAAEAR